MLRTSVRPPSCLTTRLLQYIGAVLRGLRLSADAPSRQLPTAAADAAPYALSVSHREHIKWRSLQPP